MNKKKLNSREREMPKPKYTARTKLKNYLYPFEMMV